MVEFTSLSYIEKDEEITYHGRFLRNYVDGDIMCDVYRLFHFYVKCCYNVNDNESPVIIAFSSTDEFLVNFKETFPFSGN